MIAVMMVIMMMWCLYCYFYYNNNDDEDDAILPAHAGWVPLKVLIRIDPLVQDLV